MHKDRESRKWCVNMGNNLSKQSVKVLDILDRVFHGEMEDEEIVALVKEDKGYIFVIHAMDKIGITEGGKRFKDCPLAHMYVARMEYLGSEIYRRLACY